MFIGHTRFSLFNPSAVSWRASNGTHYKTPESYREYLYSDARLAPRFEIFLGLSLPQLAIASERHELRHIVSFSEELPPRYKDLLRTASEQYSFLVLDEHVNGVASTNMFTIAAERYRESGEAFGHYRLDDDDLLPSDYFDQMAQHVRVENAGMLASLGSGATGLYIDGRYYNLRQCYYPMIAIGLLSICRYDNEGLLVKPVDATHSRSDRSNPVILDSRKLGFFWTRHPSQDTAIGWSRDEVIDIILRDMEHFPALSSLSEVEASFPSAASVLTDRVRPDSGRHFELSLNRILADEPMAVAHEPISGTFDISVDLESESGTGRNNALVSMTLVDANNHIIQDPDAAGFALAGSGLMASPNPDIGFFCYLPVNAGSHRVRRTIRLPEGTRVRQAALRRFGDSSLSVLVTRFALEEHVSPITETRDRQS